MQYTEVEVLLGGKMSHTGDERLLKRPIMSPVGKGAVDVGVVDGWLALRVFGERHALPWHSGVEDPSDEVKTTVGAELALGTTFGPRKGRQDTGGELVFGPLHRTRRGCRLWCR